MPDKISAHAMYQQDNIDVYTCVLVLQYNITLQDTENYNSFKTNKRDETRNEKTLNKHNYNYENIIRTSSDCSY